MQISGPDGRNLTPQTQKARAILAMVLVADGGVRARSWLMDHLWSTKPRQLALTSLRQCLKEIRRSLAPWSDDVLRIDNFVVAVDRSKFIIEEGSAGFGAQRDFLEGIDIGDPEFEEWLTLERRSFERVPARLEPARAEPNTGPAEPSFGLRIDPPITSGMDPEEDEAANVILDRIVTTLNEEGFSHFRDRRQRSVLAGNARWSARGSVCLRCSVSRASERAHVVLALVDVAQEQIVWIRAYNVHLQALRSEREPNLASGLAQCVDRIWHERDAAARRSRSGEDGADVLRAAVQDMFELGAPDLERAERDLRGLITTPQGSLASAWLAFLATFRVGQRFVRHDGELHEHARELTRRALEREPDNAVVLSLAGHVHSYLFGNYVRAEELFERAIRANPTRPLSWDLYSVLHAYVGRPKPGLQCALFARHLGSHSPYRYYFDTSCLITASLLGKHDIAVKHGEAVLEERPSFNSVLRFLTASYSHLGDVPKADAMRRRLLGIEPSFSIETLRDARYPGLDTPSGQYFLRGLKKAGIREVAA
jgi:tetratricopeptide (TPR) repeat protein